MNTRTLIFRSLVYYRALNVAVVLGVATAVAVLSGALIVGDSVRASLRDLFLARLSRTDYAITSPGFFRELLAGDLLADEAFTTDLAATAPILAIEGLLTHEPSGTRRSRVQVFGVDERFWQLNGIADASLSLEGREALLSPNLTDELGAQPHDTLLLRVELPSAIPLGWLHGNRDEAGRTIRLTVKGSMPAALPAFSLRPTQSEVYSVVVPLQRLQRDLDRDSRINTILVRRAGNLTTPATNLEDVGLSALRDTLGKRYQLADIALGVRVRQPPTGVGSLDATVSLESDALLLSNRLAGEARQVAEDQHARAIPIFTYLATTIRAGEREIPYSLVTAIDLAELPVPRETMPVAESGGEPPIVLNEWAAKDLGVRPGDRVTLEYYIWQERGRLETRTANFRFARAIPIEGIAADRTLAPEYPGITNSRSFSDWDPPFPVDLTRVRPQDEDYWDRYRTTPKAFVALEDGQRLWGSRYGNLTALRFVRPGAGEPSQLTAEIDAALRARLRPESLGIQIAAIRAEGLAASEGATDFGEYFTYFSVFLVVSALLLAVLFFKLGVEQRLRQIGVLRAVGFPPRDVRRVFLAEGLSLALLGALAGMAGGVLYGALVMLGLRTWWVDAVGTTLLTLHLSPAAIIGGAVAGMLAAAAAIVWALWSAARASPRALLAGAVDEPVPVPGGRPDAPRASRGSRIAWLGLVVFLSIGLVVLAAAAAGTIGDAAGFFTGGSAVLLAALCAFALWLQAPAAQPVKGRGWLAVARLGLRNAAVRPGRSALCVALVAAATFILVSVDAFRIDDPDQLLARDSGTGGFALVAEALVPLYHNPATPEGRNSLNLTDPDLTTLSWSAFRSKPGDDASCLNLYRPREPRILAPGEAFIRAGRFSFARSLATTPEEQRNPWLLLSKDTATGAVPVIADSNSAQYILHRQLGDEFVVSAAAGDYRVKIVATLERSVFQSELLMSEANFVRLFPAYEGFRYFLVDADPGRIPTVARLIEERLRDSAVDVTPAGDRLAEFRRVENTYLTTFQMLGGLGLMLGSVGLATVLVRNVLERRRELALLRAVGYRQSHLALMVISENAVLLLGGVIAGALSAALAIMPALTSRGGAASATMPLLIAAVLASGFVSSLVATMAVFRSPLLPALRAE